MQFKKRDLTKKDLKSLIKGIAIPASIGFFFQTMYNVVDTFFAGIISTTALAALSISFPVFFLILAIAQGISIGSSALIANSLGENNFSKAKKISSQAISFGLLFSVIFTILGYLVAPFLFKILGAEGEFLSLALSYINIIILGSFFFIMLHVHNSILVSTGDTISFRNILIGGFFLNLILDPWFMFGGLFIPAMGIKGIAFATVFISFLQLLYMMYKVSNTGLIDYKFFKKFIPEIKYYIEIAKQGFPASLNMMTVAIGIFIITFFLGRVSENAIAAYGIITRIEQIVLLPAIGLNIASLSIIAQNNGAKLFKRINDTYKIALRYGLIIVFIGSVFVFLFPELLIKIFSRDKEVIDIGVYALRVASITSFTYIIMMISNASLQGIKRPIFPFYIGFFRQILAPFIVFPLIIWTFGFGIKGLWWAIFLINWISAVITFYYTKTLLSKLD
jgi:putative MATE family efflux protein